MISSTLLKPTLGGLFAPYHARCLAMALAAAVWLGAGSEASAQTGSEIDRDAFLKAISDVETGGNSRAVGRSGERGMYQFRRQTWQQHTSRSFYEAHNPGVARVVAAQHLDWLIDGFQRNGRRPTTYLLAAAWNAGLTRTLSGAMPRSTRDYARRVSNIVATLVPQVVVPSALAASPEPAPAARTRYFIATME